MKTAILPSVRIEPALREELERALNAGESLSAFVEASVRESVRRRLDQAEFVQRGIASLEAARHSGHYVTAQDALHKLEQRLKQARTAKRRKSTPAR